MYTRTYHWKCLITGDEGTKEFSDMHSDVFSETSLACKKTKDEAARSLVSYWNHAQKGKWQYYLLDASTLL